jgi:hypothetical protein
MIFRLRLGHGQTRPRRGDRHVAFGEHRQGGPQARFQLFHRALPRAQQLIQFDWNDPDFPDATPKSALLDFRIRLGICSRLNAADTE